MSNDNDTEINEIDNDNKHQAIIFLFYWSFFS